jgi:hypothetical protein
MMESKAFANGLMETVHKRLDEAFAKMQAAIDGMNVVTQRHQKALFDLREEMEAKEFNVEEFVALLDAEDGT